MSHAELPPDRRRDCSGRFENLAELVDYMAETYQAEALDPTDLAEIVRAGLSELIPDEVWEEARTRGDAERAELLEIFEEVRER